MAQNGNDGPVAIVMAAGKSTRMKSERPKVLHELCGRPILDYVLDALEAAGIKRMLVVIGFKADLVRSKFENRPGVEFVIQAEQLGTGHAVGVCQDKLKDHKGSVVVIAGDQPMVRPELVASMLTRLEETSAKALIATAIVENPTGLGRILRDANGEFVGVVEQKDASPEQQKICEINPSFYAFDSPKLFEALAKIRPNNAQKEYYLTDVPGILRDQKDRIVAEPLASESDMFGINHRAHLADAHAIMQARIQQKHLDAGVTIVDPRNTYIDARAEIGPDSIIEPFTVIGGPSKIGRNCTIGPFARVREGTELADNVVIGSFVEIVRSSVEQGTAVRHLSYIGDALLGRDVNVGAGCVTANFHRGEKNQTEVGDDVAIGSSVTLIAPVKIGAKATIGAGSVVTKNHNVAEGETVVGVPARKVEADTKAKKS